MLKLFRNAIIGIFIALLPFISAEVILRMIFPEKIIDAPKLDIDDSAYQFNKNYLVSLKPDVTKTFQRSKDNGGDIVRWSTNSESFRGPALMRNPEFRIIVYGDSNIQCEFSNYEETYVYRLRKYLESKCGSNVEVINAGIVGFGPDQSLIRFKKDADTFKPDLTIFNIFADNDFGDLIRDRLLELNSNNELRKSDYTNTVDECLVNVNNHSFQDYLSQLLIIRATKKLIRSLKKDENLEVSTINKEDMVDKEDTVVIMAPSEETIDHETINKLLSISDKEYSVYKDSGPRKFSHCDDHYDIDIATDPDRESSIAKLQLMNAVLRDANNFAASKGIAFLVVIEPSRVDIKIKNNLVTDEYLQIYPKYRRTNLTGAIQDICTRNNIHCVNLFDVFMRNGADALYFKGIDNHWNDHGQDVAAEKTASYIMDQMILDCSER